MSPPSQAMSVPARIGNEDVGEGAGPREPGVDVDHGGPALLGFHHPLEADWVGLGEVGALDDDAVGVLQVLQVGRRPASAEGGAQRRDGRAVAHPGLVLDLDDAQRRE